MARKLTIFDLYVRRSGRFPWKLVESSIHKPLFRVKEMGEAYLKDKYHDRGELLIHDALLHKTAYYHHRRPKTLC